jgi:hypothetical protein
MPSPASVAARADATQTFGLELLREYRHEGQVPYCLVSHNPELELICDTWIGQADDLESFRAPLRYICSRFESGGYRFWLADLRYLNSGFHHSAEWLAETVYPLTVAHGLEREAVVLPSSGPVPYEFDVQGAASSALNRIMDGRVRGFTSPVEARRWLLDGTD